VERSKLKTGAAQLMYVLSDLGRFSCSEASGHETDRLPGIPRDVRHISGAGVHTFRFINDDGQSQLFKWYWLPVLGHRSLVYDEVTTIQGKDNNFQRVDLFNNIEAGIFPEWELAVQLFPDDGTFMWNGYDLIEPTQVIPFEINPPMKLGKMTLNRNPTNFFAEPESISFAPSNVVKGVSFVPDPLLQWRLMSYDDTATHRHNSPNGYLLPINKPISPLNNNFRDGYMQPQIFEGESTSTPNDIGGVQEPGINQALPYTGSIGQMAGTGNIGRYRRINYDWAAQARTFWGTLDIYAKQHTVDAYRFELGHVADRNVTANYITLLNKIDNCLARRVAYGIGADMPAVGSGPTANITNATSPFPSLYPLGPGLEPNKSNAGLAVAVIAADNLFTSADLSIMTPLLFNQEVSIDIVAPHVGMLASGVNATSSYILTSSVL
jgi:catalase